MSRAACSLPHGAEENVRLDAQHVAIKSLIGMRLFHAPILSPAKILDIGCGSGIVTKELATLFPFAQVVGIDMAAVQTPPWTPPNVTFIEGTFIDLVESGQLKPNSFDFIFARALVIGIVDWQKHTAAAVGLLKPGGWLEMQDISLHVYDGNDNLLDNRYAYVQEIQKVAAEKGLDSFCGDNLSTYMRAARLRRICHERFPFAWTWWPGRPETDLIAAVQQSREQDVAKEALLDMLLGSTGRYSKEEIDAFKEETRRSYQQAEAGVHYRYSVAYGQKAS